jgi:ribosomal protein L11 methyltransferase
MTHPLWHLTAITSKEGALLLSEILDFAAASCFEDKQEKNLWNVEILFEEKPDVPALQHFIEDSFSSQSLTLPLLKFEELPAKDWLKENRQAFPPLEVGTFYIYGSHIEETPPVEKICLKIDASIAFGTGQHATTQGCLMALESLRSHSFKNGLDMGCGTAILAMAMARLFTIPVLAVDNDADAILMSQENIHVNNLSSLITPLQSDGFNHPTVVKKAPYDLIAANILAEPLIHLAPMMASHLDKNGLVILSGLLTSQKESVLNAYKEAGFQELSHIPLQEWSTLVLKRL